MSQPIEQRGCHLDLGAEQVAYNSILENEWVATLCACLLSLLQM